MSFTFRISRFIKQKPQREKKRKKTVVNEINFLEHDLKKSVAHVRAATQIHKILNMAELPLASLMSRFRGCLIGALIGDCFGKPFENYGKFTPDSEKYVKVTLESVKLFVDNVEAGKFLLP